MVNVYSPGNMFASSITFQAPVSFGTATDTVQQNGFTDEQIARALVSINGKDKVLNNYQVWLGACCLLKDKYGFPKNLEACCDKIMSLPYDDDNSLEITCKYESVRKFAYLKFVNEDVTTWDSYQPKDDEKKLFYGCHQVARELDKAILSVAE